ncbi:hypothetical protein KW94_19845 [Clostridioides difficile]|nr:hypothetical protein KW94_19845 [Clostridioides difficile]MDN9645665.1 hypothetical protein [Clostridioides difficile]
MEVNLHTGKDEFFKDHEVSKNYIGGLYKLIDIYKFSMESVSILTRIDLDKLNNFYAGETSLNYDELCLIESVIAPFIEAFKNAEHNYNMIIKTRKERKL